MKADTAGCIFVLCVNADFYRALFIFISFNRLSSQLVNYQMKHNFEVTNFEGPKKKLFLWENRVKGYA